MKKQFGEYYLAFDIGTDSVGWAVTDLKYNLERFHGKYMWGSRLFEEGKTAVERRIFRAARRRLQRRAQRIKLLQEIFASEVSKDDMGFFQRLAESKYWPEDKNNQPNTLFNDPSFKDKDYHERFPTIFHLRKALIEGKEKFDVRLVYLAVHHILKNRGHFLFEGQKLENVTSFAVVFALLNNCLENEYEFTFNDIALSEAENVLKDTSKGIRDKTKILENLFGIDKKQKQQQEMIKLICGGTAKIKAVLNIDEDMELETDKLCFKNMEYEPVRDQLLDTVGDLNKIECLDRLKAVFDWALLAEIKQGNEYLSFAKVDIYEQHKNDIKLLKKMIKKYFDRSTYNEIFNDVNIANNYVAYVGTAKKKKIKQVVLSKKCTQEDFCKYIKGYLDKIKNNDTEVEQLKTACVNISFAPKQINRDNGVIPYQMHLLELEKILANAGKYLSFLNTKDADGFTAAEKIKKIMCFRIPYYVGPLNNYHMSEKGHCWIVRKKEGKIRPWNFDKLVDKEACAEAFISRMTNKCTYLCGEDVLPKDSLLYSKFVLLNELNNVCINGDRLPADLKQHIYRELFMKHKKVTAKNFREFLLNNAYINEDDSLSGFDGDFKGSLNAQIDFNRILGSKINDSEMLENIIKWIVLFGDVKELLKKRIKKFYGNILNEKELKDIANLKYAGWGRLSRKFLEQITSPIPGFEQEHSIIAAMYETQNNLMELLSGKFQYAEKLQAYNNELNNTTEGLTYKSVEDLYVSPAVKRSIWQTIILAEEIKNIMGHEPRKVFIEMTRSNTAAKKRTVSRKNQLMELYKNCSDESRDWSAELGHRTDSDLRGDKLFLYYTQMGRCMYTNEIIDLGELFSTGADGKAVYDIEHIYPQSKIKDDSIDNRVLVKAQANRAKGDKYPVPQEYKSKCSELWKMLLQRGFISSKKYDRLIRNTPFTEEELAGFIARQIVATSQSTKAVAELLTKAYKNTEVVYVKAGDVSAFRQKYDFEKCREVNDYHHAKDAYLNIVVGNVYNTKFTHNPVAFIKCKDNKYSLNKMFDFKVERSGSVAWEPGDTGTLATVKQTMLNSRVLFTRYASQVKGGLFDQQLMKKGQGQQPIKGNLNDPISNIQKYGGYNKITGSYFFLVEHTEKQKRIRTIEYVPLTKAAMLKNNKAALLQYCLKELQLKEPRLLLDEIKMNTLFKVEGFKMHLSGRTGNRLLYKGAEQLILEAEDESYIKKITKYIQRSKDAKAKLVVTTFDKLDSESNLELYDKLLAKLKNTVYGIWLGAQIKKLEQGRTTFENLSIEDQVRTLFEILHLFQCKSLTSNLKAIGGAGTAGTLLTPKKISALNKISIIHQSPTGLFEQETDLLQL